MSGSKAEIEELKQDANEARSLLASATRRRLKDLLSIELSKIETKLKALEVSENICGKSLSSSTVTTPVATGRFYTTIIRNYSWDQSDKFLKLYITLNKVQDLEKEKVICNFEEKSLNFKVLELEGKNHELNIANLAYKIIPEKSYFKVKTDMVVIFGAKAYSTKWETVTAEEKKVLDAKKSTKPDAGNKDDPTSGLMGLMKQMYDEGDDDMKRMLNKTWYESQQKTGGGGLPSELSGMENMGI